MSHNAAHKDPPFSRFRDLLRRLGEGSAALNRRDEDPAGIGHAGPAIPGAIEGLKNIVSLDPYVDRGGAGQLGTEVGMGFVPFVGASMDLRDFVRSARSGSKGGMALAAGSFILPGSLGAAFKVIRKEARAAKAVEGALQAEIGASKITSASVKAADGQVFKGMNHGEAAMKASRAGAPKPFEDGFNAGEQFYTREQAGNLRSESFGAGGVPMERRYSAATTDIPNIDFNEVPADKFHAAVTAAGQADKGDVKVSDMLHVYAPDEYSSMKTFLSADGKTGYAVKPDGDLVSVFNVGPRKGGQAAVLSGIENGATKLDAFEPFLPQYYHDLGFQSLRSEANWTPGGPDVAYMGLRPELKGNPALAREQRGTYGPYKARAPLPEGGAGGDNVGQRLAYTAPDLGPKANATRAEIQRKVAEYVQRADNSAPAEDFGKVKLLGKGEYDPAMGKRIADVFEKAKATPNDPATRAAYEQFQREVNEQYDFVTKELGIKMIPTSDDPYKNSTEMMRDLLENKQLRVFSGGEPHPLVEKGESVKFRFIHDVLGHGMYGNSFGKAGEENAARAHSEMFSRAARPAMLTETRGQNSWVNYGPHGEHNRANPTKTIFAEQKPFLMPDEFNSPIPGASSLPPGGAGGDNVGVSLDPPSRQASYTGDPRAVASEVYRGVTADEAEAIAKGGQIQSTGAFSHPSEGTSFGQEYGTAEDYVNVGRDDPTKTGRPTYVLEVGSGPEFAVDPRDHYPKAKGSVPADRIKRAWRFNPDGTREPVTLKGGAWEAVGPKAPAERWAGQQLQRRGGAAGDSPGVLIKPEGWKPEPRGFVDRSAPDIAGTYETPAKNYPPPPGPRAQISPLIAGMMARPEPVVDALSEQARKGLQLGGRTWYELGPVKAALGEAGMDKPSDFLNFNLLGAASSAQSPVPEELVAQSIIQWGLKRGLTRKQALAEYTRELKKATGKAPPLPKLPQKVWDKAVMALETGDLIPADPQRTAWKMPSYLDHRMGGAHAPSADLPGGLTTLDAHERMRLWQSVMADPFLRNLAEKSGAVEAASKSRRVGKEMLPLTNAEDYKGVSSLYHRVAEQLGIPFSQSQPSTWLGGAELTGLRSPPKGDFAQLLDDALLFTLQASGGPDSPRDVQRYGGLFARGDAFLLNPAGDFGKQGRYTLRPQSR